MMSSSSDPYKVIDNEDIIAFKSMTKSVLTDSEDLKPYNTDWMNKYTGNSKVVLRPKTVEEVSAILNYCNKNKIAVVPQGGNTGLGNLLKKTSIPNCIIIINFNLNMWFIFYFDDDAKLVDLFL